MGKYEGKRLLVLGGAAQSTKIVKAAKEMGIHTIVVDINDNAPAKKIADEGISYSLMDCEGILEWCKKHPVDGVINICIDYAQRAHQYLCEKLGLPGFGTEEQLIALTDKETFKKACVASGVDVIPEYSEEDALNGKAELPLFVKPAENSGSRGMTVCTRQEEVAEAVEKAKNDSRNGRVIIEKYMKDKPDFMVCYVIVDGEPYLQRTADRYHGTHEDGMEKVSALAISPSKYTDLFMNGIHDRLVDMMKKLGLRNSAAFFQGFVDGGKIYFYDPGIRLAGANFENILKAASGIDIVKMYIEYALSGKMPEIDLDELKHMYLLNRKYAAMSFPIVRPGVIAKICGQEKIEADPHIVSGGFRRFVGHEIKAAGDVSQRLCEYNILADSKEELRAVLRLIEKELITIDENGEDMMVSKPDLSQI